MHTVLLSPQRSLGLTGLTLPLLLALPPAFCRPRTAAGQAALWAVGETAAFLIMLWALAVAIVTASAGPVTIMLLPAFPAGIRLDLLTAAMSGLIGLIGWVIVRYSKSYMDGDPGRMRYFRWLGATLAAVLWLVIADNLLMLALCWTAASLALHHLLTFYGDRPAARMAAHKKFVLSRCADLSMLCGVLWIGHTLHTLEIDRISHMLSKAGAAPAAITVIAVLFAITAILRSAQLPFHGWLIQVMEAPTPVSALLHAGIVNVGGFVLIRIAGVLDHSLPAQILLATVGGATALFASIVMMTRVSVKVSLAWSTCAQMGFLLLECGLGAYSLALLHLLGHSLYKAYAFLSSGSTVAQHRLHQPLPHTPESSAGRARAVRAVVQASILIGTLGAEYLLNPTHDPAAWVFGIALALALLPLASAPADDLSTGYALSVVGIGLGLCALYSAGHFAARALLGIADSGGGRTVPAVIGAICLSALYVLQSALLREPGGRLSRWLYPHAFAGFHLDEVFTRLCRVIWPAPLVPAANALKEHRI